MELTGFSAVSQRDGSINGDWNCVAASIAAAMQWVLGKPYGSTQLKNAAYGDNYTGGTAATNYVAYCATQGASLASVQAKSAAETVMVAHQILARGFPVIFTQQDDYAVNPDFTHVCVWYKANGGSLTAMDPFIAQDLTYTDAMWADRLRQNELWVVTKKGVSFMPVPTGWSDVNGTLTPPDKKFHVVHGFRELILNSNTWDAGNVPRENEQAVAQVELHANTGAGSRQIFRDCMTVWTSAHGVHFSAAGDEIMACYKRIQELEAKK